MYEGRGLLTKFGDYYAGKTVREGFPAIPTQEGKRAHYGSYDKTIALMKCKARSRGQALPTNNVKRFHLRD